MTQRRSGIPTGPRGLIFPALLCLVACAPPAPPGSRSIALSREEIADIPPHLPGKTRTRTLEKTPRLGVYHVEQTKPLLASRFSPYSSIRILLLAGRMDARVGGSQKTLGPGSFISIPPHTKYRFLRLGEEPLNYIVFRSPDIEKDQVFENGSPLNSIPNGASAD